jgi:hypothetical protein
MTGKRLFVFLAAGTLLLLQFADCMSAMTLDQHSMQCCASMPCTPANQSHDCCKKMTSPQTPSMLPTARMALHAPTVATIEQTRIAEIVLSALVPSATADDPPYSPPELYTLHASLLI